MEPGDKEDDASADIAQERYAFTARNAYRPKQSDAYSVLRRPLT